MLQGKVGEARKNGSVILKSYDGAEVARYNFTNAWVSKITTGTLKAGANEVLMEGGFAGLRELHQGVGERI